MTDNTDPVADGLRRALEAAELANDAAEDVSRLGKAHHAFSDRMIAAQKRTTALAGGALAGSFVALGLASLVYFRSVADLHEAAELQAEAAKLVVEQVLAMKDINEGAEERAKAIETGLQEMAAQVVETLDKSKSEDPVQGAAEAMVAEMAAAEERILAALAELDLRGSDGGVILEALARIEAGLLRASAAPAKPEAHETATAPAPKPKAEPAPKPSDKTKPRQAAAPEPNPFAYP